MKLKKVLSISAAIILFIGAIAASVYYYYYNVQEVKDYFLFSISEPQKDLFGKLQAPHVEITQEQNWGNDSLEIVRVTSMVKSKYKFASKKLDELDMPADSYELLKYYAERDVLLNIISAQHSLICISHVRSYDAKDFLETLKQCNGDLDKINEYVKDKKINIHYHTINPL